MTDQEFVQLPIGTIVIVHHWWNNPALLFRIVEHVEENGRPAAKTRSLWPARVGMYHWEETIPLLYSNNVVDAPMGVSFAFQNPDVTEDRVMELLDRYLPPTNRFRAGDVIRVSHGSRGMKFALIAEVHPNYLLAFKYAQRSNRWTRNLRRVSRQDILGGIEFHREDILRQLAAPLRRDELVEPLALY